MVAKPTTCSTCPLYKSGRGFVPDAKATKPRLLIQGEGPDQDDIDDGTPFSGKGGFWLARNILENAGITRDECVIGNTLRCMAPFDAKSKEHYPKGDVRKQAEACCRQYDTWSQYDKSIPLLLFGGKALGVVTGEDSIAKNHGSIQRIDGRLVGSTFAPAKVMAQPNLLPVVINEVKNLLDAADSPNVLDRPTVNRYASPDAFDKSALVFDLEWDITKGNAITTIGTATSPNEAFSTHYYEPVIDQLKSYKGCLAGHNIIDADFDVLGFAPESFKPDRVFDTKIVAHLIHAHLAELGLLSLGSLSRMNRPTPDWKQDKADTMEYNGRDCAYNWRLYQDLKTDLTSTNQWHLVEKQQRLAHLAVLMRNRGIRVDSAAIATFDAQWTAAREALKASFPFNPNSPKQVKAWASQEDIELKDTTFDTISRAAKASGNEILQKLGDYKDEGKPIKVWFNEQAQALGYLHPTFNVTGTAVARFSCAEPNCQNIPPYLRHIIVPRSSDLELVSFDFSNIENRTCAWIAGDMEALDLWATGVDPYLATAALMFGCRYEEVTKEQRAQAKTTELATLYGETAYNLATRLFGDRKREHIQQAQTLQYAYFQARPRIRQWQQDLTRQMDKGEITLRNPFGRVRYIYARDSHERMKRACHYMGCSTAADWVNGRMLAVWDATKQMPLMVVHDEIVVELPKGDEGKKLRGEILARLQEPVKELDGLVLPAKVKIGANYGTMQKQS